MMYLDDHPNILQWSSEEFFIPYKDPTDGKLRRYFPDFYVRKVGKDGSISTLVIEVKPKEQTMAPKRPEKLTETYVRKARTYAVNEAKWKAAIKFCDDRDWKFQILTEHELGIK